MDCADEAKDMIPAGAKEGDVVVDLAMAQVRKTLLQTTGFAFVALATYEWSRCFTRFLYIQKDLPASAAAVSLYSFRERLFAAMVCFARSQQQFCLPRLVRGSCLPASQYQLQRIARDGVSPM